MTYYLHDIRIHCYLCVKRPKAVATHQIARSGSDRLGEVCEPCGKKEVERLNREEREKPRNGIEDRMDG